MIRISVGPVAMRRWVNGGEGEEKGNSKVLSLRDWELIVPLIETRKSGRNKEGGGWVGMQKGKTIGLAAGPVVRASMAEMSSGMAGKRGDVSKSLQDNFWQFQDATVSYW